MRRRSLGPESSAVTAFGDWRARAARALLACVALGGLVTLGGCNTEGIDMAKAMRPLPDATVRLIESKGMAKTSPILIRVYKEESELEVWKQDNSGRFALLKTYPICRWSGELGPKTRAGDRQAPEGFYDITPGQMNPNSQYYLSFNMGYPNAYDRAWGRTGAQLMVHGDCSSAGCYSMTDEQIAEIYALGRDAFFGGQRSFQVQAYPFRMTALNMARHRNNPNFAFWKMLKVGSDHFEATGQQPKVDVCEKHYVFDAQSPDDPGKALSFKNTEKCPAYKVADDVAAAVAAKEQQDDQLFAGYVGQNVAMAPIKTGRDGGMNPVFAAQYRTEFIRDKRGVLHQFAEKVDGGSIGNYESRSAAPAMTFASAAPAAAPMPSADVPWPRPAPGRRHAVAAAAPMPAAPAPLAVRGGEATAYTTTAQAAPTQSRTVSADSGNFFDGLFSGETTGKVGSTLKSATSSIARTFGIGGSADKPAPQVARRPAKPEHAHHHAVARRAPAHHAAEERTAEAAPAATPAPAAPVAAATPRASRSANASGLMAGSQPIVPAAGFESRWQALR
jgi:murein L,D-transpeptidase YafK